MKLEDIRIVGEPLVLATPADVDGLESRLWIAFPEGYRDYVTRLGEGILGGSFIRIYPPWRIENEIAEWRRRINKYWFWDEGRHVLPKECALECVIIGDTRSGDEIVFHPVHQSPVRNATRQRAGVRRRQRPTFGHRVDVHVRRVSRAVPRT